ncbi:hypothetical protein LshimejAT787_2500500 [Lyophyllum shimeji]|uniref:Zinc finger PHD-type domain-containing protein n=1 Tax=Lyophyllum shimeji TaxID=47721 RepID=A0A9P3Q108_LYOSH|nr:hypothetical protein LshimejAT787_2500500 [Lyophyllum shimeji]
MFQVYKLNKPKKSSRASDLSGHTLPCPNCGRDITVGSGGQASLNQHIGSIPCLKNIEADAREAERKKTRTLLDVGVYRKAAGARTPAPSPPVPSQAAAPPVQAPTPPEARDLLAKLRNAIARMPNTVPTAAHGDTITLFAHATVNPGCSAALLYPFALHTQLRLGWSALTSTELQAFATSLYAQIAQNPGALSRIVAVPATDSFPYRFKGRAAFVCNGDVKDANMEPEECPLCKPTFNWDPENGPRVIEHIGTHILFDSDVDRTLEICGFCAQPTARTGCVFYLRKNRGSGGAVQVDLERSTCPNLVYFSYHAASTFHRNSPCTNVPVACPVCSPDERATLRNPAIWRYSMAAHLRIHHASSQLTPSYLKQYEDDPEEVRRMEEIWTKRFTKGSRSRKVYYPPTLAISEAHRASNVSNASASDAPDPAVPSPNPGHVDSDNNEEPDALSSSSDDSEPESKTSSEEDDLAGPEFFENTVVSRAGRVSRKWKINEIIGSCECDQPVTPKEIKDGVAVKCSVSTCETKWYHLVCMYLERKPPGKWQCPAHSKKKRVGPKPAKRRHKT